MTNTPKGQAPEINTFIVGGLTNVQTFGFLGLLLISIGVSYGQTLLLKDRDAYLNSLPIWNGKESYTGHPATYRLPSGDSFVFVYPTSQGVDLTIVPFQLQNRNEPSVAAEVSFQKEQIDFIYSYTIGNGLGARDAIWGWEITEPSEDNSAQVRNSPWQGVRSVTPGMRPTMLQIFPGVAPGLWVLWRNFDNPLAAGQSRGPFLLESPFLPGLTTTGFMSGKFLEFPDEPPDQLEDGIEKMNRNDITHQLRLTVGPRYAPTVSPAKWAELLARDLRAAYDVIPTFRQSAYIQQTLKSLDDCAASTKCISPHEISSRPVTQVERDIQRGIEAASTWFANQK
jgi:hypothetical protein